MGHFFFRENVPENYLKKSGEAFFQITHQKLFIDHIFDEFRTFYEISIIFNSFYFSYFYYYFIVWNFQEYFDVLVFLSDHRSKNSKIETKQQH